jgi:hypothetical protein
MKAFTNSVNKLLRLPAGTLAGAMDAVWLRQPESARVRIPAALRHEDPRAVDVPFSLFSVLSVFVNPWVWEHYWVLLIQPAFVVANTLYRMAHGSFRAWLDEELSARVLVLKTSGVVLGATAIAATMKLIGTQDIRTDRFLELYNASKSPWAHRQLHLWEAFNSLPWVIMLVLCYSLSRVVPGRLARPTAGAPQRE